MYDPGEEVTRNAEAATVTNSVYNWSPWTVCHGGGWNMEEAGGYLQHSKMVFHPVFLGRTVSREKNSSSLPLPWAFKALQHPLGFLSRPAGKKQ